MHSLQMKVGISLALLQISLDGLSCSGMLLAGGEFFQYNSWGQLLFITWLWSNTFIHHGTYIFFWRFVCEFLIFS